MFFNVNDYNIFSTGAVREYLLEVMKEAREDNAVNKNDLINLIENCLNDESCPLSWDDSIIVRKV